MKPGQAIQELVLGATCFNLMLTLVMDRLKSIKESNGTAPFQTAEVGKQIHAVGSCSGCKTWAKFKAIYKLASAAHMANLLNHACKGICKFGLCTHQNHGHKGQ
eukprot:1137587-Pelagomonas_calceolata.AAC.1